MRSRFDGQMCRSRQTQFTKDMVVQRSANFSIKGQIINILGFDGHTVSIAAIPLCHFSAKAARDNGQVQLWSFFKNSWFIVSCQFLCIANDSDTPIYFFFFIFFSIWESQFLFFFKFLSLFSWHIPRNVGSQLPEQRSNLCPLHWKSRVPTRTSYALVKFYLQKQNWLKGQSLPTEFKNWNLNI